MSIYKNDVNVFRIDTGIPGTRLSAATKIRILVLKPDNTTAEWTATQYGTTTEITYTTIISDLDETGTYTLQAYIEFTSNDPHYGDAAQITVLDPFTIELNVPKTIKMFSVYYRYLTVQTLAQYNTTPEAGTDVDIDYESFGIYLDLAQDELTRQLNMRSIPVTDLTESEENAALCHLIADAFEQGNPDWNFTNQSQAPGVSFSRGKETGPMTALNKLLDSIELAVKRSGSNGGRRVELTRVKDAKNYPRRFKRSDIPAWDTSETGFDADEVSDLGQSIYDQNQNPW